MKLQSSFLQTLSRFPAKYYRRMTAIFACGVFLMARTPWAQQQTCPPPDNGTNAKCVQGRTWADFQPTAGGGLNLNIAAGTAVCNATVIPQGIQTLTMAAAIPPATTATNYVYLDPSFNCVAKSNTSGFQNGQVPIATLTTDTSSITGVTDVRGWFVTRTGPVLYATDFPGADAGSKMNNCITALPASGGTCDARGLEGNQSASASISIPSSVHLILGKVNLSSSQSPVLQITGSGARLSGLLPNAQGLTGTRIVNTGSGTTINDDGGGGGFRDQRIEGLLLDGSNSAGIGVNFNNVGDLVMDQVRIINHLNHSIQITGSIHMSFRDVRAEASASRLGTASAVNIDSTTVQTRFWNCYWTSYATEFTNAGFDTGIFSNIFFGGTNGISSTGNGLVDIGSWFEQFTNKTHVLSGNASATILFPYDSAGITSAYIGAIDHSGVTDKTRLHFSLPLDGLYVEKANPFTAGSGRLGSATSLYNASLNATDVYGDLTIGGAGGTTNLPTLRSNPGWIVAGVTGNLLGLANYGSGFLWVWNTNGDHGISGSMKAGKAVVSAINDLGTVTPPATAQFDASKGNTQKVTLGGLANNTVGSTFTGGTAGEVLYFIICQDTSTGSHKFSWPGTPTFKGAMTIPAGQGTGKCNAQDFIFDGTTAYALSPGVIGM